MAMRMMLVLHWAAQVPLMKRLNKMSTNKTHLLNYMNVIIRHANCFWIQVYPLQMHIYIKQYKKNGQEEHTT